MTPQLQEADQPTIAAVRWGRFIFCFIRTVLLVIGGWFAHSNPQSEIWLSATCLFFGVLCVWLGLALPPKLVAHLGFNLPWFLP